MSPEKDVESDEYNLQKECVVGPSSILVGVRIPICRQYCLGAKSQNMETTLTGS